MRTITILILSLAFMLTGLGACKDTGGNVEPGKFGKFIGDVVVSWVENGVDMKLVEQFGYVSPNSKNWQSMRWDVPTGTITNGASIPGWLWTPLGSPFVGKYRRAAVVHDYYTEIQTRPSRQVHYMFYTASLAGGSTERTAKYMYGALLAFGDKWSGTGKTPAAKETPALSGTTTRAITSSTAGPARALPTNPIAPPDLNRPMKMQEARQKYLKDMLQWITEKQPSPDQIEAYVIKHKQPGN